MIMPMSAFGEHASVNTAAGMLKLPRGSNSTSRRSSSLVIRSARFSAIVVPRIGPNPEVIRRSGQPAVWESMPWIIRKECMFGVTSSDRVDGLSDARFGEDRFDLLELRIGER